MKRAKNPHFRPRNLANQPIKLEPSQRKKSVAPLYQVEDVGNAENQHQTGYHLINGAVSRSIQQPARSHQSDARMPRSTSTSGSRRACHSPLGWRHEAEEFARIHRTQDVEGIRTSSQDSEERVGMRFTALHQREDGTVRSTTTDSAATTTRHLLDAQSQRIEDLMRTLEGERRTHQSEMLSQIEAEKKRSILADQRYEKLTKEYQTCQETLVSVQREHDSLQQKLHAAQSALQTCESERKGEALHRQHIEQTRDYLSDHLRRATDDLERWKRRAQDAEALVMDLKIELKSGVELHHRCRQLEADLQAAREAHQHAVEEGEGWRRHSHEVERYVEEYETLRPEIQRLRVRYEEQQTALATLDKEKQFLTKHLTEGIETRDAEIARLRGLVSLPPSRDHTVDGSAPEEADIVSRLLVEQHELRNRLEEYRHQVESTVSALREDVRLKEAERIYVQSRARNAEQKVEELSREIESLQKDRNSALGLRRDLEQALSEVREALS